MSSGPEPSGPRRWTVLLVALALTFPVGALLQPWLWPSRSHLPLVDRQLHAPVLLITAAGLRADRVHHLGYPLEATPALDRVADDGVSFPLCFTNGNDAAVTLAALFTGACPASNGVRGPGDRLPDGAATLAERMRDAGYATVAVTADGSLAQRGLQQGFGTFRTLPGEPAAKVLETALDLLRAAPRPNVFVWADLGDLLPPYGGPALDNRRFAPDAPAGFGSAPGDYDLDAARLAARGWGPRELTWLSARYAAALAQLDAAIGACLDTLSAEGRLENMTICITGTRGERLDERPERAFTHGCDLFDASLHVPLLLRFPGAAYHGMQPRRLVQSTDIASTLMDLGVHRPWPTPQGQSLTPVILYQQRLNKSVFAEGLVQPARGAAGWHGIAQRLDSLKVIFDDAGKARAAFRLTEDPLESQSTELGADQLKAIASQAGAWSTGCLPAARH